MHLAVICMFSCRLMKVLIYESLVRYLLGQLHSQEDGDQRFLDFLVIKVDITLLCSFV